jgi:hypothetical protein
MQDEKTTLFLSLLATFKRLGLLDDLIVVGGWCQVLYRVHFNDPLPDCPATAPDADFLIINPGKNRPELDVAAALETMGFETQHAIGQTKYIHGEFEVGFLAEKKGKAEEEAWQVRSLMLGAMTMRYLDFLQEHVIEVAYEGYTVKVPEPAAFVLQKFLINPRRSKAVQAKDVEGIVGLCGYMLKQPKQVARMRELFTALPGSLKKTVLAAAEKHAPDIGEIFSGA